MSGFTGIAKALTLNVPRPVVRRRLSFCMLGAHIVFQEQAERKSACLELLFEDDISCRGWETTETSQ